MTRTKRNPQDLTLINLRKTRRDVARLQGQLRAMRASTMTSLRGLRREVATWRARASVLSQRLAALERKAGQ